VQALRGVDLEVRTGEVFGFLGPNGAGKTTTIRCLLDLIRPDGGSVQVMGVNPQVEPVVVRARVGYLPGELHLDENMTVEGVLRFFNSLRGRTADWGYVRQLAERLDLNLKTAIKNLSKGNKQKVGIVQALMHHPALLILDEPTAGLDPLIQKEVLRMILDAQQGGTTVFFSSHILSEVQDIADRVAIIRKGVVVEVAKTDALVGRSLRRVRVRFIDPVDDFSALLETPGLEVLEKDAGDGALFQVEGQMDAFVKALADFSVLDFETENPSLEDVFLAYYKEEE
jgi:ABC-2 type transport system ATP-binding protein